MKLSSSKIIFFGISLILILLPLIYIPSVFNPYEFPKFLGFVIATYLLVLFWAIVEFRGRHCERPKGARQSLDGEIASSSSTPRNDDLLSILVISFGVINFIADIFGLDPRISLMGSMWRYQGFLLLITGISFFFLVHFQNKSEQSFNVPITISLFSVSLYAVFQGISFNLFHDNTIPTYLGRIVGMMGNPNSLAGYLVVLLPLMLFQQSRHRKAIVFLKIVAIILVIAVMIISQSQSASLAGIIILILFIFFTLRKWLIRIKKLLIIVVPSLIFIIVAVISFTAINLNKDKYRQFELSQIGREEKSCIRNLDANGLYTIVDFYQKNLFFLKRKSYCDNRILIWIQGIKALYKSPILGFGQENYELIFPKSLMMKVDNAHNIFLEVAVSSGLIGLTLYLAIIIAAMKQATMAVRFSLLAFLIVAQFNPLSIPQIMFFWFLLGLIRLRGNPRS